MGRRRIEFAVEVNPALGRVNASLIPGKQGRFVPSQSAKQFKKAVGAAAALEARRVAWERLQGPVEVFIRVYAQSWLLDVDAATKAILDSLGASTPKRPWAAGLYEDDRRVVEVHLSKRVDPARPRIAAAVQEATLEPDVKVPGSWGDLGRKQLALRPTAFEAGEDIRTKKEMLSVVSPKRRAKVLEKRLVSSKKNYREDGS